MTIIVIRDGVMAVDSLVASENVRLGTTRKWREVTGSGGGYVAATGDAGHCAAVMDKIAADGDAVEIRGFTGSVLWLRADGTVRIFAAGGWFDVDGPFHAEGSGCDVAMGALAMGASAERAAWVACDLVTTCGGPVTALRARRGPT